MKKVHFIGISGTGLSAIAKVLLERGYKISGSDRNITQNAENLSLAGATVYSGHSARQINDADLVIRSSAVPEENVEVQAAYERSIPVLKRSQFLSELIGDKRCIAVSGTHGKTTTTAMIAWILYCCGIDPSYIIGSVSINLGDNAHEGLGDIFVIEADEYDHMFLGLEPNIAIVTNVEYDHPDFFPTSEDFYQAFVQFAGQVENTGSLLICGNDSGAVRLSKEVTGPEHKMIFGIAEEVDSVQLYVNQQEFDFSVQKIESNELGGNSFQFRSKYMKDIVVTLQIPGIHNVLNAAAALSTAELLELPLDEAAKALIEFKGTDRRFEIQAERNGVIYVNDYAHHPTEIRATLAAARTRFPKCRILAVWQPHTYSRSRAFLKEFSNAFNDADYVVVTDIYAAREKPPADGFDAKEIVRAISEYKYVQNQNVRHVASVHDTALYLEEQTKAGDVVIILSAGDADLILQHISNTSLDQEKLWDFTQLKKVYGDRLREKVNMSKLTAARIGGPADALLEINSKEELAHAVSLIWENRIPLLVLGSGSNILVSDRGFQGIVLLNKARKVDFGNNSDTLTVWAESGANLGVIARQAARRGLVGIEWAAGIPGSIGGAVVGNAGAHGCEIADALLMAEILHLIENKNQHKVLREKWSVHQFEYSYRSSLLKQNPGEYIVLAARFGLRQSDPSLVQEKVEQFTKYRRRTQPPGASWGSMFKNPAGDYAGRLIDAAGLKGVCIGDAEISSLHANFFINRGNATADDVLSLIQLARKEVFDQFDIELELEIELIGDLELEAVGK